MACQRNTDIAARRYVGCEEVFFAGAAAVCQGKGGVVGGLIIAAQDYAVGAGMQAGFAIGIAVARDILKQDNVHLAGRVGMAIAYL